MCDSSSEGRGHKSHSVRPSGTWTRLKGCPLRDLLTGFADALALDPYGLTQPAEPDTEIAGLSDTAVSGRTDTAARAKPNCCRPRIAQHDRIGRHFEHSDCKSAAAPATAASSGSCVGTASDLRGAECLRLPASSDIRRRNRALNRPHYRSRRLPSDRCGAPGGRYPDKWKPGGDDASGNTSMRDGGGGRDLGSPFNSTAGD
jgi:hypothetical protein